MWLVLLTALHASEPPLAIPGKPDATQGAVLPTRPADVAAKLYDYRTRRLQVRGMRYAVRSPTTFVHMGYGYPYWGLGSTYVIEGSITEYETWAAYQGSQRLTVPAYLRLVQHDDTLNTLNQKIKRSGTANQVWFGTGLTGGAAVIAGLVGTSTADTYDSYNNWNLVANAGLVALITGFVGAGISGSRNRRLRSDFTYSLDYVEVREAARTYNERLRSELGLSPRDVAGVE